MSTEQKTLSLRCRAASLHQRHDSEFTRKQILKIPKFRIRQALTERGRRERRE